MLHCLRILGVPMILVMAGCGQLPDTGTASTGPSSSQPPSVTTASEVVPAFAQPTTTQPADTPVFERAEVDGGRSRVQFAAPQGSREAPLLETQDPSLDDSTGDQVLLLRSWFLDGCACNVYLLVQRDPGPDAATFKLPPIATFETKAAKWTVADIGEKERFYMTAIATINGLLIQVTGNGASLDQIEEFAQTVTVEDLK